MYKLLKNIYTQLLNTLFPPREDEAHFLGNTMGALVHSLPRTEGVIVINNLNLHACFAYKDPHVRALVRLIKYRGNTEVLTSCGEVLAEEALTLFSDALLFDGVDTPLLIPIPLSAERLKERGFNQTERLAHAMQKAHAELLIYAPDTLIRRSTPVAQANTRSRKERLQNMQNVFTAKKSVKGHDVLLLDDVITTGATMKDATRALKEAGARHVCCIALAH